MMTDTIAAIATPPGHGGVGVVRVSGDLVAVIAGAMLAEPLQPRHAHLLEFTNGDGDVLDQGIALYFPAPHSYTGQDVLELQGHGGPVVQQQILEAVLALGARLARPGEFTERAFLNDKLDLTQAEAIIDLIQASSQQAARCAVRSLQGQFSSQIQTLVKRLIHLRLQVEAAIDFPDEDLEFIQSAKVVASLEQIQQQLQRIRATAQQGVLLQEGMTVVIAGRPNAGKSSLLNALSGRDSAIVTEVAGTTRDIIREHIDLDGLPLHVIDTAGLRDSDDQVEQEGLRRARVAIAEADVILLIVDASIETPATIATLQSEVAAELGESIPLILVNNKSDLLPAPQPGATTDLLISAKCGDGIGLLKQRLQQLVGYQTTVEGAFTARARHLEALQQASQLIEHGCEQLQQHQACELLAEDLRQAQQALNTITGEFSSDDLLGEIFSQFCIGK